MMIQMLEPGMADEHRINVLQERDVLRFQKRRVQLRLMMSMTLKR
jgi:hypothetical protein